MTQQRRHILNIHHDTAPYRHIFSIHHERTSETYTVSTHQKRAISIHKISTNNEHDPIEETIVEYTPEKYPLKQYRRHHETKALTLNMNVHNENNIAYNWQNYLTAASKVSKKVNTKLVKRSLIWQRSHLKLNKKNLLRRIY